MDRPAEHIRNWAAANLPPEVPEDEFPINHDVPRPGEDMGRIEKALLFMVEAPMKLVDWLEDKGVLSGPDSRP